MRNPVAARMHCTNVQFGLLVCLLESSDFGIISTTAALQRKRLDVRRQNADGLPGDDLTLL